ncbi:MAG TPA: acyltransferase [Cyclobacteriaceae bacterium]|nr:acyltransferase [Cyclobacteriaceae bacterium]
MTHKKIYFENLDGLRFLSFLAVFLFHSFHTDFDYIKDTSTYHFIKRDLVGNGNIGVNFFFVLSGFLITYLLLEEKKLLGQIDLKKFWIRRILRIWPLFYFCVLFGFFIFPFLKSLFGQTPNETASLVYYLTFTNNFDFIAKGPPDASILGVLWSVAIEEQFYALWPIVLFLLPIIRHWIAFVTVIITSIVFIALTDNYEMREYHTVACIGDMAVGALGAWLISESATFKNEIVNLSKIQIIFIYVALVLVLLSRDELRVFYISRVTERLVVAVIALAIILEQNYSANSFYKMSRFKMLSKLGVISYGLYCYHFIGILTTTTLTSKLGLNTSLWQVMILETCMALGITIVIGMVSYRFFETPFLKLKNRFEYIHK